MKFLTATALAFALATTSGVAGAQTYYFCLAENEIQDCAPAWSQCRLACGTSGVTAPGR